MKEEQQRFLTLWGQLPARLTVEQVAWVLNCQPHDVPVLVSTKLLKPLGNPPANGIKFFAMAEVVEQTKERTWLTRVTLAINRHWQKKNAHQKIQNGGEDGCVPVLSPAAAVGGIGD